MKQRITNVHSVNDLFDGKVIDYKAKKEEEKFIKENLSKENIR